MSRPEGEVLRTGTWLYDGCVEGRVRILKIKGDGLPYKKDEEGPLAPREDANGFYYIAEFHLPPFDTPNNGSRTWGCATADEAIKEAEDVLRGGIRWK